MNTPLNSETDSSRRVMCVSHIKDVDGCVSAALVRLATQSSFLLTDYGHISDSLKNIKDVYDVVYFCDLGIRETILEEFERIRNFAELTYIDHHNLDKTLAKKLEAMDVKIVHNLKDCASVLTFNHLQEKLPSEASLLAAYAAVSDRLEDGPIAKKLIQRHDRDFVLFEAMLLSHALERANMNLKRTVVTQLSSLEYPHQIGKLPGLALEQVDRMVLLREILPSRATTMGKVTYIKVDGDSPGAVANLLLDVCGATVGISFNSDIKKLESDLSLRGSHGLEMDLGKVTAQLAEKFGGFGGGHPKASGARIPTSRLLEFIRTLAKQIK